MKIWVLKIKIYLSNGVIMDKKILYGLILLLTLSLSLGAVSASDNYANEAVGISLEAPANDVSIAESKTLSAYSTQEIENINDEAVGESKASSLLGVSNEEDILGNRTITPSGTTFKDIRDAIDNAIDGDIIDLGGLTYKGIYNKNLGTEGKYITIQNGIIDGINVNNNAQVDYGQVTFKNIHFKNFNY